MAVLDFKIRDRDSEPVALALRRRSIPFIVCRGTVLDKLTEAFEGATLLGKPYSDSQLQAANLAALGDGDYEWGTEPRECASPTGLHIPESDHYVSAMSSSPPTPKSTVKVRRLPQVGDTIMIPAIVTRIAGDDESAPMTVRIKATGHLTTARAEYLLKNDA